MGLCVFVCWFVFVCLFVCFVCGCVRMSGGHHLLARNIIVSLLVSRGQCCLGLSGDTREHGPGDTPQEQRYVAHFFDL